MITVIQEPIRNESDFFLEWVIHVNFFLNQEQETFFPSKYLFFKGKMSLIFFFSEKNLD